MSMNPGGPQYPPPGGSVPPPPPGTPGGFQPPTQPVPAQPGYGAGGGGVPPQYGAPQMAGGMPPQPPKKKTGMIVGIVAAVAVAAGGIGYVATQGDDDKGTTSPGTTVETTTVESTTPTTSEVLDNDRIAKSVVEIWATLNDGSHVWHGSGTILNPTGLILTNAHVVSKGPGEQYDYLEVHITDNADEAPTPMYQADVVGWDPVLDLATVQIARDLDGNPVSVDDLPWLPVGDSDSVGLGDNLRVFGYPAIGGDTISLTEGSVSGFTTESGVEGRAWVKSDATIAGGVSGGTAVNEAGELVAIPTRAAANYDGDVTDCRIIQDTNKDGQLDENDTCIPIGGFINGLRPVNLAADVIATGEQGVVIDPQTEPIDTDTSGAEFTFPVFSYDKTADGSPVEIVDSLPSGAPNLCAFFDAAGVPDGTTWSAVWYVNGELSEWSMIDQTWNFGDAEGSYWLCIGDGVSPLADGLYELILQVGDGSEFQTSNTVFIGDQYQPIEIEVVNNLSVDVCYLFLSPSLAQNWGPDEIGVDAIIPAGQSLYLPIIAEFYWVRAQDCDRNDVATGENLDLSGGLLTLG